VFLRKPVNEGFVGFVELDGAEGLFAEEVTAYDYMVLFCVRALIHRYREEFFKFCFRSRNGVGREH